MLPAEAATRNLAYLINLHGSMALDCKNFLQPACSPDLTKANEICEQYDFSNLEDLRIFVNATWFNETSPLTDDMQMTDDQV
jgi:hypothetical protein